MLKHTLHERTKESDVRDAKRPVRRTRKVMPADAPSRSDGPQDRLPAPLGVLLIVVGIPVVLVSVPVWLPTLIAIQAWGEHRFRKRMRARGRFVDWADLVPRLRQGDGTLIVEQAQKIGCRVWWTDLEVLSRAEVPPPPEKELDYLRQDAPHPFVSWCHKAFIAADRGAASLTLPPYRYPPGFVEASFFREKFPALAVVMTVKQA